MWHHNEYRRPRESSDACWIELYQSTQTNTSITYYISEDTIAEICYMQLHIYEVWKMFLSVPNVLLFPYSHVKQNFKPQPLFLVWSAGVFCEDHGGQYTVIFFIGIIVLYSS